MSKITELKDKTFSSTTEMVEYLMQRKFTFKVDPQANAIYILDKSNPSRHRSREYTLKETSNGKLYLSEV